MEIERKILERESALDKWMPQPVHATDGEKDTDGTATFFGGEGCKQYFVPATITKNPATQEKEEGEEGQGK